MNLLICQIPCSVAEDQEFYASSGLRTTHFTSMLEAFGPISQKDPLSPQNNFLGLKLLKDLKFISNCKHQGYQTGLTTRHLTPIYGAFAPLFQKKFLPHQNNIDIQVLNPRIYMVKYF